jgi:hypothetical protein
MKLVRLGLGVVVYLIVAGLILEWDIGARCHQGPFRPRAVTHVVTFPFALLAWRDWLAEMPANGVSCDDFDMAMVSFLAFLGPLNGILWTWVIARVARAVRSRMAA